MPCCVVPSSAVTQTRASTRRTPSMNNTAHGCGPGVGVRGDHSAAGTSTSTSGGRAGSDISASSMGAPYSGAQPSTANLIEPAPSDREALDGGGGGALAHLEPHGQALGQVAHVG